MVVAVLCLPSPSPAATADASVSATIYAYNAPAATTTPTANTRVGAARGERDDPGDSRPSTSSNLRRLATKAGRGGAGPVRVGQAGEDAVRSAYDIGPKVKIDVAGTKRIPDGLTPSTLSEVKNVGSLSYTRQLRDYVQFAQGTGRRVDLYVRGGRSPTNLSGPLRDALSDPSVPIRLRRIP